MISGHPRNDQGAIIVDLLERLTNAGAPSPDICAGWALRTRRELAGVRQAELARSLNVARQRLSASETGDWNRGLDQSSLAQIDESLGAHGMLLTLRQELHRLRNPRQSGPLLSELGRLDVNHRVRHNLPVRRDMVLYVDAFELAKDGVDLLHDQRAKRTLDATIAELQLISTTRNHYLIGALNIFGHAGFGQLNDLLRDPSNISPWRALEALPLVVRDTPMTQHNLLTFLDINGPFADDIKRHRPTIDAIYDLGSPIGSVHLLHQIAEQDECFPEARVGALVLSSGALANRPHLARQKQLLRQLSGSSPILSATSAYISQHMAEGEVITPMYRYGSELESLLLACIGDATAIRDRPLAIRLICQLVFAVRERERRAAGLTLRASGLSGTIARDVMHTFFATAPEDSKGLIARNCLSHLGDSSSAEFLLQFRTTSDGICRAHIAWALGRFAAPGLANDLAKWLLDERNAERPHPDVIAALEQAVASKHT